MKYGKRFLDEQSLLGELYSIDYKLLKKLLKQRSSSAARLLSLRASSNCRNSFPRCGPSASCSRKSVGRVITDWSDVLLEEMDKVDVSFRQRELELVSQLHHLHEKLGPDGLSLDEAQSFLQQVSLLRKHITLNIVALFKIVKKHDKQPHRAPLWLFMTSKLVKKRMAKSLMSSLLFDACEPYIASTLADDLLSMHVQTLLNNERASAQANGKPSSVEPDTAAADKAPVSADVTEIQLRILGTPVVKLAA